MSSESKRKRSSPDVDADPDRRFGDSSDRRAEVGRYGAYDGLADQFMRRRSGGGCGAGMPPAGNAAIQPPHMLGRPGTQTMAPRPFGYPNLGYAPDKTGEPSAYCQLWQNEDTVRSGTLHRGQNQLQQRQHQHGAQSQALTSASGNYLNGSPAISSFPPSSSQPFPRDLHQTYDHHLPPHLQLQPHTHPFAYPNEVSMASGSLNPSERSPFSATHDQYRPLPLHHQHHQQQPQRNPRSQDRFDGPTSLNPECLVASRPRDGRVGTSHHHLDVAPRYPNGERDGVDTWSGGGDFGGHLSPPWETSRIAWGLGPRIDTGFDPAGEPFESGFITGDGVRIGAAGAAGNGHTNGTRGIPITSRRATMKDPEIGRDRSHPQSYPNSDPDPKSFPPQPPHYAVPYAPSRSSAFADEGHSGGASYPPPRTMTNGQNRSLGQAQRTPEISNGAEDVGQFLSPGKPLDGGVGGVELDRKPEGEAKDFVACSSCRKRKIKCDGARPTCTNCEKKGYSCEFDTQLKRRGPDKVPGRRGKRVRTMPVGEFEEEVNERKRSLDRERSGSGASSGGRGSRPDSLGYSASTTGSGCSAPGLLLTGLDTSRSPFGEVSALQKSSLGMNTSLTSPHYGRDLFPLASQVLATSPVEAMSCEMMAPTEILAHALHPGAGMFTERGLVIADDGRQARGSVSATGTNGHEDDDQVMADDGIWIERLPDGEYARDTAWLWMTGLFSSTMAGGLQVIDREMRYFFDLNYLWFAFINRPLFFSALHHPTQRFEVQPALVLAMLAMSSLIRTSRQGGCNPGRVRASRFADAARSMITQSVLMQKVDPTLAQAALILAVFEACPHPNHTLDRFAAAVKLMDGIIGMFKLLSIDVSDHRVSIFVPGDVPRVQQPYAGSLSAAATRPPLVDTGTPENDRAATHAKWSPTPQWPTEWTLAETRKDEARRLCWTASAIVASFSHWNHVMGEAPCQLYLTIPGNYALYFEAEAFLIDMDPEAGKKTLWALYHRVILLWHFTINMAHSDIPLERRSRLVDAVWEEAGVIERDLFDVKVDGGHLQKWQARDWLLATKSLAKSTVQDLPTSTLAPSMAKSWLKSQAEMAELMRVSEASAPLSQIPDVTSRPFFVWWFMIQLKHALDLYASDSTMVGALIVAKGFFQNVEAIRADWPCPSLVRCCEVLKGRLQATMAGRTPVDNDRIEQIF